MSSPIKLTKQKLSAKAAAAKKRRDIAMAKTPARKAKKAQNQRLGQEVIVIYITSLTDRW